MSRILSVFCSVNATIVALPTVIRATFTAVVPLAIVAVATIFPPSPLLLPAPATDFSNVDLHHFSFLQAGSGYDPVQSSITIPILHPEAEYLFGMVCPSLMNMNVQSYLEEIRSSHHLSLDFLEWMIDIPQVDLLTCALLVNSKFDRMVLVDIETPNQPFTPPLDYVLR